MNDSERQMRGGAAEAERRARGAAGELPDLLQWIADELGLDAALKLAHRFGGQSIYVSADPTADSPLALAFGIETARAIGGLLGSGEVTVPVAAAAAFRARRAEILRLRDEGRTVREIAETLGISERSVWYSLARARRDEIEDARQMKLFGEGAP